MVNLRIQKGILDEIYPYMTDAFPVNELKSYQTFKVLCEAGCYDVLLGVDTGLIGYALIFRSKETNTLWLDYIAVLPNYQSLGYGSLFLKQIMEYYSPNYKHMLLEAEIPSGQDPNQEKRIAYYKRLGGEILPIPYYMPTYEGPFPMHLIHIGEAGCQVEATIQAAHDYIHRDVNKTRGGRS